MFYTLVVNILMLFWSLSPDPAQQKQYQEAIEAGIPFYTCMSFDFSDIKKYPVAVDLSYCLDNPIKSTDRFGFKKLDRR